MKTYSNTPPVPTLKNSSSFNKTLKFRTRTNNPQLHEKEQGMNYQHFCTRNKLKHWNQNVALRLYKENLHEQNTPITSYCMDYHHAQPPLTNRLYKLLKYKPHEHALCTVSNNDAQTFYISPSTTMHVPTVLRRTNHHSCSCVYVFKGPKNA